MRKLVLISLLTAVALPLMAQQQQQPPAVKYPRLSQHAVLTQTVGLTDITIDYSRPGVKDRKIWGALVPYGKVWRTGANEATMITFSDDVTINGKPLPKGTYSLHTIPEAGDWTIIFNKVAKQWGSFSYKESEDALRVTAKPYEAPFTEWMLFDVPSVTTDNALVELRWEKLGVSFAVATGTTAKVLANAKAALATAKPDDFQAPLRAASFAFQSGNMADAMAWVDRSIKAKQTAQNLYLRGQIDAKEGNRTAAVKNGEAALALTGDNKELAEEIQKSISEWKK